MLLPARIKRQKYTKIFDPSNIFYDFALPVNDKIF